MKSIIQKYLGANFVLPFVFSGIFFLFFLLTFDLLKVMKLIINKGVPISLMFVLLWHLAASFLPMAIPLSVLFASIFTLNRMSADSEYLAMRSFGFSIGKLFRPFLIIGLFISCTIFALNMSYIPYSYREFKRIVGVLTSKGFLTDVKPGQFFTEIPLVTIYAERVEDKGQLLGDVFINIRGKDDEMEEVIFAKKGLLIKKAHDELGSSSLRLKLSDGNIVKKYKDSEDGKKNIEKILFKEYDFPLFSKDFKDEFVTRDSMRTTQELWKIINSSPGTNGIPPGKKEFVSTQLEFWSRIHTPFQCLVFVLLGFTLGVQKSRGKNQNSATVCFITLIIYNVVFFTGIGLAKGFIIPAWFAVFFPSVITTFLALWLFRRLEWVA